MSEPKNPASTPPVVLIDGSSYLFRAFHALPPLTNKAGHPTGAIKGVVSMVRAMLNQYPDSPVAVVFDTKGPTFRNELYADYKANRPPMPEDLAPQISPIHDIIRAMGLPLLAVEGVEADDVIGTLARQATADGRACIISTGDKDMAQLVSAHVSLVNTMSNESLDEQGVTQKYGFGPELIIDYLALMGDKSDNIPGVPGVGEKTAKALLSGLGGIDTLYANLEKIPELGFRGAKTLPGKLSEHESLARLSYELATIRCDVDLPVTLSDLKRESADTGELTRLYREFEFTAWLKELGDDATAPEAAPEADAAPDTRVDSLEYQTVVSPEAWQRWLGQTGANARLAVWPVLDSAHYRLGAASGHWLGVAVSDEAGRSVYLDFRADSWPQDAIRPLNEFFCRHSFHKVTYDLKRTLHALYAIGIEHPSHLQDDALLLGFVRDATVRRHPDLDRHFDTLSLDNLVRQYLGESPQTLIDVAGPFGAKQKALKDVDREHLATFACERADYTGRLYDQLSHSLSREYPGQWGVYRHIEIPLAPVLQRIEWTGVRVDRDCLAELSAGFRRELEALEKQAHEIAGSAFNLDSPKQLGEILFTRLQLPVLAKTPSGQPSTNEDVLTQLAADYDLPACVLRYRHLRKLLTTYTDPLPELINEETGRVHTTYHQTGAQTGRLSSTEPNLQNIPIRSPEGRSIRRAFVAGKGRKIVAADYSQIELRIMTHLSGDANLLAAFRAGKDIHTATAAEILGVAEDEITGEQRRSAKAVNFGLIYGMSAFGLARNLGIGRREAQTYVDTYFERYPGVRRYMDETRAAAAEQGYVETLFGRRLYLPDIKARQQAVRRAAERTAINAPMQGTAADIIKQAMVDVQTWLERSELDACLVMQVHDELVMEVSEQDLDQVIQGVKFRMQHAATLSVPLEVDVGVGDNWDEAH